LENKRQADKDKGPSIEDREADIKIPEVLPTPVTLPEIVITPEATPTKAPETFPTLQGVSITPNSNTGFKCQPAESRGGSTTVCLLPYTYTVKPFYTKIDHHKNKFGCNVNGDTYDSFTLISGGQEYKMSIEKKNPFDPEDKTVDYFCQNYVGTSSGNIGRTHVRLKNNWNEFNGKSVSIRICDKNKTCDNLRLR